MFSVDFATLEQIIHQFTHTGIFRAAITRSRLSSEEGFVELQVYEGSIVACRFVTRQGIAFKWDDWERRLMRLGVLNWEQVPGGAIQPSVSSSRFLPAQSTQTPRMNRRPTIPRHAPSLNPNQARTLSMLYRQVFHLIDGQRQIADIAAVLHRSEQEIGHIIEDLVRQGLVEFN